jgi:N-acetylglucosaminyl-diphospho-decaprenol L-rhamnosyltransferase
LIQENHSSVAESKRVTISIVSHGHGAMVFSLLSDLALHCRSGISVVLTLNIPESTAIGDVEFSFPVKVIRNASPRGFGANHNAAFKQSKAPYFCVLNPDIRIDEDPFPPLIDELASPRVGVVAPKIVSPAGNIEDSARHFPTVGFLARKLFGFTTEHDYSVGQSALFPDWVAGMFMLFRAPVFDELQGFDERYFLYYEDVDLCRRLRKCGYEVRLVPTVRAVHDARRESHRNLRHLRWHLASILRFFLSR